MIETEHVKNIMLPVLERAKIPWGHYCRENRRVVSELKDAGLLIDIRYIERDIKTRRRRKNMFVESIIEAGKQGLPIFGTRAYFPRGNRIRLFKKMPVVKLPRNSDQDIRVDMLKEIRRFEYHGDIAIVGYDWEDNDEFTITSLDDCFRADSENERLKTAKTPLRVQPYPGNPEVEGTTVVVYNVPSWSSNETYTVFLYRIGSYVRGIDPDLMRRISRKFESKHSDCEKAFWLKVKDSRKPRKKDINQNLRTGKEHYQDQHVILAFKQAKPHIQGRVIDPFLERKDVKFGHLFYKGLDKLVLESSTPKGPRRDIAKHFEREYGLWDLMEYNSVT
ncbi:hypothetical protein GF358_03630 [Candidatus Woesearchaeota archaeon]|nr:hypothetical protein [Candidatus Woesearchaeota archaeon]